MLMLSVDSSAAPASVCLFEDGKVIADYYLNTGFTHSQTLMPMIEDMLRNAGLSLEAVDALAVAVGPGSFTGLRIGVATVKGLALGTNKPCVGVSTLEALAYNLVGCCGLICPVMNARRNQLYNALFLCQNGRLTRICDDRLISVFDLEEELKAYSDKKIYLCGDGYDIAKNNFSKITTNYGREFKCT